MSTATPEDFVMEAPKGEPNGKSGDANGWLANGCFLIVVGIPLWLIGHGLVARILHWLGS